MCGNDFSTERARVYCCNECMLEANKKMARERHIVVPKDVANCLVCGKEFEVYRPFQKCCSESCQRKNNYNNNKEKILAQRKADRIENKEEINRKRREYHAKNPHVRKISNLRHHEKARFGGNRQACFDRDGNKCTQCGSENNLVPHHIDHSGQSEQPNHSLDNLVTLCKKCHMALHDPNPNKRNRVECTCKICGETFEEVPSRIKGGRGKTCSLECKYKYISLKNKGLIE